MHVEEKLSVKEKSKLHAVQLNLIKFAKTFSLEIKHLHTGKYGAPCPYCKKVSLNISDMNLAIYFANHKMYCPGCNTELNWWSLLLSNIRSHSAFYLFDIVGAFDTTFSFDLTLHKEVVINMDELGIPKSAKILSMSYTPNGTGVFPVEIHGNNPVRHHIGRIKRIYGRPMNQDEVDAMETVVIVASITWIEYDRNDVIQNLIEAFEAFSIQKFASSIIPANVSVESKLNSLLDRYLKQYAGAKKVELFLESGATYSHQLNVLLPLIIAKENFMQFPDSLRGQLNKLRTLRNDIAHTGKFDKPIESDELAEMLCATAFTLGYLRLFETHLFPKKD